MLKIINIKFNISFFKKIYITFLILIYISCEIKTKNNNTKVESWDEQILKGNLALPISQRPSCLFSFGQRVVDKNDFLLWEEIFISYGKNKNAYISIPQILYGLSHKAYLFIEIPETIKQKNNNYKSSGMMDLITQLETLLFCHYKLRSLNYSTIVTNITLPTGSAKKKPNTGFGSPSFFLGFTLVHLSINWYAYTSHGAIFTTKDTCNKYGYQYLYQAGFGRNLKHSKKWIYCLIFEANGILSQKNLINNKIDKNSGGNIFYFGPDIWISNKHIIIQSGFQFALTQQLFGKQNKNYFLFATNIAYKF